MLLTIFLSDLESGKWCNGYQLYTGTVFFKEVGTVIQKETL